MTQWLKRLSAAPSRIFLFDAAGAGVSLAFLIVILIYLRPYFGLPKEALYFLMLLPPVFIAYDLVMYTWPFQRLATGLRIIAFANLGYSLLAILLFLMHRGEVTPLGWAYLVVENIIIIALAVYELRVAKSLNAGPTA